VAKKKGVPAEQAYPSGSQDGREPVYSWGLPLCPHLPFRVVPLGGPMTSTSFLFQNCPFRGSLSQWLRTCCNFAFGVREDQDPERKGFSQGREGQRELCNSDGAEHRVEMGYSMEGSMWGVAVQMPLLDKFFEKLTSCVVLGIVLWVFHICSVVHQSNGKALWGRSLSFFFLFLLWRHCDFNSRQMFLQLKPFRQPFFLCVCWVFLR
jgi:hypothetical protein